MVTVVNPYNSSNLYCNYFGHNPYLPSINKQSP